MFRKALLALAFLAVARYYLWAVQATGDKFAWDQDSGGYYNYLARGLVSGHSYLPIEPAPQILAAANPWDPAISGEYKMHDMAFYKGRYYLYHGVGPAVLLFAPWRLVTGHDMPERFAAFLLCSGGLLVSCLTLLRIFELEGMRPGPAGMAAIPLALGLCQSVPFLLNRAMVYETAIAGGYFCVSAAYYFSARGLRAGRPTAWLACAGLMFGWAVACRPHLGLAGAAAILGLIAYRRRIFCQDVLAIALPFAAAGLAVALYNYSRFDDPFEFGIKYLFSGLNQNRIRLSVTNLIPGAYFFLACAPDFSAVFPWVHMVLRHPPDGFPPGYVIEPATGALYLAPFIPGALWLGRRCGTARLLVAVVTAGALGVLAFHLATGWTTQRYEVDFLPALVLSAVANIGIRIGQQRGPRKAAMIACASILVVFGIVVNLALGITGPYDDMLRNRPPNWVRLAGWFSFDSQHRPMHNPRIDVSFTARFSPQDDGASEPLLTVGRNAYRYFLTAEHSAKRVRIASYSEGSKVEAEVAGAGPRAFSVRLEPETGDASVTIDGVPVLTHRIKTWVAAPSQISVGINSVEPGRSAERFSGLIEQVRVAVEPNR